MEKEGEQRPRARLSGRWIHAEGDKRPRGGRVHVTDVRDFEESTKVSGETLHRPSEEVFSET